jgi:hypothetical protein
MFMGWSAAVAAKFGVRSFMFFPMSAHMWLCGEAKCWDRGARASAGVADAVGRLQALPDFVMAEIHQHMEFTWRLADGILVNTFMELEPKFLRHLERRRWRQRWRASRSGLSGR